MPKLCLNMIVKNEAARILRALESAAPHISSWVIVDTGSTDGTPDIITKYFTEKGISGRMAHTPFVDFSHARNVGLNAARDFHRNLPMEQKFDYLLLMDADMELRVIDPNWLDEVTGAPAYNMYQEAGSLYYQNARLLNIQVPDAKYVCVTHEYLDVPTTGAIPREKVTFIDHADGANRVEKYKRDIALIKEALKTDPNNSRYFYYLAQSYRDAGKIEKAIKWYKRRVKAGGWDEEVWHAQLCIASCYLDLKDEDRFVLELMKAYNMRPSRAEAPYELAKFYRMKGQSALAVAFADAACKIPRTTDGLFVLDYPYTVGAEEEVSISAFYMPGRKEEAFSLTDKLALRSSPYAGSRELARTNLFHYLEPLKTYAPSFQSKRIGFHGEDGWTTLNPSVTNFDGYLRAIVRTVNYEIDESGRYSIGGNFNLGDDNPIRTRNYLVDLMDDDPSCVLSAAEVLPRGNEPEPLFKAVLGYEDMRLFHVNGDLWTSSCRRDLNPEGYCEQVLARLQFNDFGNRVEAVDMQRMLREPRLYEKNWMPIQTGNLPFKFMYRLGHVINDDGKDAIVNPTGMDTGHISGGSQIIPFDEGFLCLTHEARLIPGKTIRYYAHRFAWFDSTFVLRKLSRPFVFDDRVIEFAAGLCWHPDDERLVISYGYRDREARIATIDHKDVRDVLWHT